MLKKLYLTVKPEPRQKIKLGNETLAAALQVLHDDGWLVDLSCASGWRCEIRRRMPKTWYESKDDPRWLLRGDSYFGHKTPVDAVSVALKAVKLAIKDYNEKGPYSTDKTVKLELV